MWSGKRSGGPWWTRGNGDPGWSTVEPVMEAAEGACHITPIWDLCHYGFPGRLRSLLRWVRAAVRRLRAGLLRISKIIEAEGTRFLHPR